MRRHLSEQAQSTQVNRWHNHDRNGAWLTQSLQYAHAGSAAAVYCTLKRREPLLIKLSTLALPFPFCSSLCQPLRRKDEREPGLSWWHSARLAWGVLPLQQRRHCPPYPQAHMHLAMALGDIALGGLPPSQISHRTIVTQINTLPRVVRSSLRHWIRRYLSPNRPSIAFSNSRAVAPVLAGTLMVRPPPLTFV